MDFKVDSVKTLSHLHQVLCVFALSRVLQPHPDLKESLVVLLFKVQLEERGKNVLTQNI